jgi:hypothetical protein
MIDLNKEAEKVLCYLFPDNEIMTRKQYNNALGAIKSIANSKYVKQQILLAQIDILKNICNLRDSVYFDSTKEGRMVEKLQQKLKQLQDVD